MQTLTLPPPTEARKGERTRAAILDAAARSFRSEGFDGTTLAGVAEQLGITRSAVLHHFSSKAALLEEVVRPFFEALDEIFALRAEGGPFTGARRRRVVTDLVDVCADNRDALVLLNRDVSVHQHLPPELQLADRVQRWVEVTQVDFASQPQAVARALAAVGAVSRPLAAPDELVDTDDPATRAMLVQSALAVLKMPLPG
jgi:AcrR family transcriptional regulator